MHKRRPMASIFVLNYIYIIIINNINNIKMKIKEFIEENEVVVKNWLVENNVIDEDDVDDIEFGSGGFEDDKGDIIESEEICGVVDYGIDFSFKRKFVKDKYGDSCEEKLVINNKNIYVLIYNI
jgi:hypothetical protein